MPTDDVAARLASGWVVTDGDRPLFGADPDRPGIVTPLLPDRRAAASLAAIVADGDEAWATRLGVAPLGNPWAAMRAFAARGIVGLSPQGRWDGGAPPRVRFAVRRREVGSPMPTVLAADDGASGWKAIVPPGVAVPDGRDVVAWVRHDITDRAAITFRDGMPLGQELAGAPLYEVRATGRAVVVRDDPVAAPWGQAGGVVQLVADPGAARDRCEVLATGSGGSCEVVAVPDLAHRLRELALEVPGATVTVNAHGHREHAAVAYASRPEGVVSRWWAARPGLAGPVLRGPGGVWTIGPGNRFDLVDEAPGWSGGDTFFWDGVGAGVPVGQAVAGTAVAWWEVSRGPSSLTVRQFEDAVAAIAHLREVVASIALADDPAREAVLATLGGAEANTRIDLDAVVRLVNLSGVGVFVEGIGGGEVGRAIEG